MPKTKSGEIITWKEFMARWKEGMQNLTPEQKLSNEIRASLITLIGYLVSLIAVTILREKIGLLSYGLILIFIGSSYTTFLKYFSQKKQLNYIKDVQ